MKVRHAELVNVYGRPAKQGGFTIVPADVELEGSSFRSSFPLAEFPSERIPPILRAPLEKQYDVTWVRARLPHAFGISPEPSETEKTLLWSGFVAVPDGEQEGIAFWCTDYYGKTSLTFSEEEIDESLKQKAATAFWEILLSEPDMLEDFEASVLHLGTPVVLHFGCVDSEPFFFETAYDES